MGWAHVASFKCGAFSCTCSVSIRLEIPGGGGSQQEGRYHCSWTARLRGGHVVSVATGINSNLFKVLAGWVLLELQTLNIQSARPSTLLCAKAHRKPGATAISVFPWGSTFPSRISWLLKNGRLRSGISTSRNDTQVGLKVSKKLKLNGP